MISHNMAAVRVCSSLFASASVGVRGSGIRGFGTSKSSKAWMERHKRDVYVKKSVQGDMRSRSSFKFIEIHEKFKLIKKNHLVIDLGAAPGGWSLACSKLLSAEHGGMVVGIDLLPFRDIDNVARIEGDFRSPATRDQIAQLSENRAADVVVSDMLHNTTGDKSRDHFLSMELVLDALEFTSPNSVLKRKGSFLAKYLRGSDEQDLIDEVKERFNVCKIIKPKASRQESKEMYILGMDKKGDVD